MGEVRIGVVEGGDTGGGKDRGSGGVGTLGVVRIGVVEGGDTGGGGKGSGWWGHWGGKDRGSGGVGIGVVQGWGIGVVEGWG